MNQQIEYKNFQKSELFSYKTALTNFRKMFSWFNPLSCKQIRYIFDVLRGSVIKPSFNDMSPDFNQYAMFPSSFGIRG